MAAPHFPVRVPIEVRFRDLDSLGHVNNAVYLTYDEIGRGHYLRAAGWRIDSGNFVMARAEVDFLRPVLLGEAAELAIRVTRLGNTSFRTRSELWAAGALAARAEVVVVWLEEGQPTRIPDGLRQAVRGLERDPVEGLE